MKKSTAGVFAIATLAAAGIGSHSVADQAADTSVTTSSVHDDVKAIVEHLSAKQAYILAGHRSHASHASHASHSSHRSYVMPPREEDYRVENANPGIQLASIRNDQSTPSTSILPSSPAITQKLKVLPGNSMKFQATVQQMKLALIARGYEINRVDGELDARTRAAVYKFQVARGMPSNGKVTPGVLAALNISTE